MHSNTSLFSSFGRLAEVSHTVTILRVTMMTWRQRVQTTLAEVSHTTTTTLRVTMKTWRRRVQTTLAEVSHTTTTILRVTMMTRRQKGQIRRQQCGPWICSFSMATRCNHLDHIGTWLFHACKLQRFMQSRPSSRSGHAQSGSALLGLQFWFPRYGRAIICRICL